MADFSASYFIWMLLRLLLPQSPAWIISGPLVLVAFQRSLFTLLISLAKSLRWRSTSCTSLLVSTPTPGKILHSCSQSINLFTSSCFTSSDIKIYSCIMLRHLEGASALLRRIKHLLTLYILVHTRTFNHLNIYSLQETLFKMLLLYFCIHIKNTMHHLSSIVKSWQHSTVLN